jgi:hypothetical protein
LVTQWGGLLGEFGLRVLRDQFAFPRRSWLPGDRWRVGGGIERGELVIGFTGTRCGNRRLFRGRRFRDYGRRSLIDRGLLSRRFRRGGRRRLSGLDEIGDRGITGHRLETQQQARVQEGQRRVGQLGNRWHAILPLGLRPMRASFFVGLRLDGRRPHGHRNYEVP